MNKDLQEGKNPSELDSRNIFDKFETSNKDIQKAREYIEGLSEYEEVDSDFLDAIGYFDSEDKSKPYDSLFSVDYVSPDGPFIQGKAFGYEIASVRLRDLSQGSDKLIDHYALPDVGDVDPSFFNFRYDKDFSNINHPHNMLFVPNPDIRGDKAKPFLMNHAIWNEQFQKYKFFADADNDVNKIAEAIVTMSIKDGLVVYVDWKDVEKVTEMNKQKVRYIADRAINGLEE